jgi:hypothetical protein
MGVTGIDAEVGTDNTEFLKDRKDVRGMAWRVRFAPRGPLHVYEGSKRRMRNTALREIDFYRQGACLNIVRRAPAARCKLRMTL